MFVIYLDANVVENCKQMDKLEAVDFSLVDLQMITDIASQENLFSLIVNSLCPTIFGHQLVKGTATGAGRPQVLPLRAGRDSPIAGLCFGGTQRGSCWPCLLARGGATTKTRCRSVATHMCSSWATPVPAPPALSLATVGLTARDDRSG